MKKLLMVVFALVITLSITEAVCAKEPFASIDVPKCATAPTIDGVISDGEYKLVTSYDENAEAWKKDTTGVSDLKVKLDVYATWDDTYFYYAVKVSNHDPNYTPGPNKYVFEQASLMTGMVYDDPTLPVFATPGGKEYWDWGEAAAAPFAREWTVGTTKDGTDFTKAAGYSGVNHFGSVRSDPNYKVDSTAKTHVKLLH